MEILEGTMIFRDHKVREQLELMECGQREQAEKAVLLSAMSIRNGNRKQEVIPSLAAIEYSVSSQWGEDGILDWLIEKTPGLKSVFVEIGTQDYRESNTRYLLQNRNWTGYIFEGNEADVKAIQSSSIAWRHDLRIKQAFVTRENIQSTLRSQDVPENPGLLSLDIDGNDYWVWEAMEGIRPGLVVLEYNSCFGDLLPLAVPYQANFRRSPSLGGNIYFGASIQAMIHLSQKKGYEFLGTGSNGCNSYYIRKDLAPHVLHRIIEKKINCAKFTEARGARHELLLLRGKKQAEVIESMPVINLLDGKESILGQLPYHSPTWFSA